MKLADQLTSYINAAFSGIYVQTHEPDEAEREIVQHAQNKQWKVAAWDVANGLRVPGSKNGTEASGGDPLAALRALPALADDQGTAILLLHNFHRFLSSAEVVQTVITHLGGRQTATHLYRHPFPRGADSGGAGETVHHPGARPSRSRST